MGFSKRKNLAVRFDAVTGLLLGLGLISATAPEQAFAFESAKSAIEEICAHIHGNLGALLMTTAGVGALVAAAFGNLRATHSLIITAIGAAAVSALLSLYFSEAGKICESKAPHSLGAPKEEKGGGQSSRLLGGFVASTPGGLARTDPDLGFSAAELAIATGKTADYSSAAQFRHGMNDEDEDELDVFDREFSHHVEVF